MKHLTEQQIVKHLQCLDKEQKKQVCKDLRVSSQQFTNWKNLSKGKGISPQAQTMLSLYFQYVHPDTLPTVGKTNEGYVIRLPLKDIDLTGERTVIAEGTYTSKVHNVNTPDVDIKGLTKDVYTSKDKDDFNK